MTFKDYWDRLIMTNQQLKDESAIMRISVASLKKELAKSYLKGKQEGDSSRKPDIFDNLFGDFRRDW